MVVEWDRTFLSGTGKREEWEFLFMYMSDFKVLAPVQVVKSSMHWVQT